MFILYFAASLFQKKFEDSIAKWFLCILDYLIYQNLQNLMQFTLQNMTNIDNLKFVSVFSYHCTKKLYPWAKLTVDKNLGIVQAVRTETNNKPNYHWKFPWARITFLVKFSSIQLTTECFKQTKCQTLHSLIFLSDLIVKLMSNQNCMIVAHVFTKLKNKKNLTREPPNSSLETILANIVTLKKNIETLGWPPLVERRAKIKLTMFIQS